jgi:hypothetical protein
MSATTDCGSSWGEPLRHVPVSTMLSALLIQCRALLTGCHRAGSPSVCKPGTTFEAEELVGKKSDYGFIPYVERAMGPNTYSARAEELLARAKVEQDPELAEMLECIAAGFQQLAANTPTPSIEFYLTVNGKFLLRR